MKRFIPQSLISVYHFFMALFGAILYQFPSRKLKVIGVTGTNGKSTVVELTIKILEEAGYKVALLNSIKFKIGEKELPNELRMTMPGRFFIQRFLRQAADARCQYAILEVTSEGIKQYRHLFINFDIAVLTNLTPEHIEAHGGFENYKKTKGKLFEATKNIHIINLDDENAEYFLQFQAEQKYGYVIENLNPQIPMTNKIPNSKFQIIEAKNLKVSENGIEFSIKDIKFNLKLLGEFNIYNALAAVCVGLSQGIDLETCKSALEKVAGIPGRMELVIAEPFKVFVDYAFTPNSLEKVYQTLTQSLNRSTTQRLICVLGACGGGRDKWKRPVLGKIAAQYCNEIIITNEDPYDENPLQIIKEVMQGVLKIKNQKSKIKNINVNVHDILDRREAIKKALSLAKQGDTVIITGKGCEPSICLAKGKRMPWDDRRIVKEEFKKLYGRKTT